MPTYTPDPTDPTQPTDGVIAETAAAEFRAMKAYIAGLVGLIPGANLNAPNLAINPIFKFNQILEATATADIVGSVQTLDGWSGQQVVTASRFNVARVADAANIGQFRLKATTTIADAAPAAGAFQCLFTVIEGSVAGAAGLNFGQPTAKPVTIQFEAESSVAGTYGLALQNIVNDRNYVTSFNLPIANTRFPVTITIPGDTIGNWSVADGAIGLLCIISLLAGTNYQISTPAQWIAGDKKSVNAQVNFFTGVGNTFFLSKFAIKQESAASPFIAPTPDKDLEYCQRYFQKSYNQGVVPGTVTTVGAIRWGNAQAGAYNNVTHILYTPIRLPVEMAFIPVTNGYSTITGAAAKFRDLVNATDVPPGFDSPGTTGFSAAATCSGATTAPQFQGHYILNARLS